MKLLTNLIFDSPAVSLFLAVVSLFLLYTFTKKNYSRNNTHLPPHPPKLPFLGNLLQIGSLPHQSLNFLSLKYGPLMLVYLGETPYLIVSSSDMAEAVMRTYDLTFATRPPSVASDILLAGDMAFGPYGNIWRQMRKISTTHLLSSKNILTYKTMKEEEIRYMMQEVKNQACLSNGVAIDMSKILYSFANNIICRIVSGKFFRDEGKSDLFRELIEENVAILGAFSFSDLFPSLACLEGILGLSGKSKKHKIRWDKLLDEVIELHIQRRECGDDGDIHENFVDVLLSSQKDPEMCSHLSMENVKGLLIDMFAAGTDTTYIALEWAMAELLKNPNIMTKLQYEVRRIVRQNKIVTSKEVTEMPYLQAVIKETLRLHPPSPLLLPRQSMEECNINGYIIPKGIRVLVNFWAIGREIKSWETPYEFKPERFIGSEVDYKGTDFQFIPFGAGRRICPGMNFASSTVELALANLIYQFDWELPCGMTVDDFDMKEAPGFNTRKKEALRLIPKYRTSIHG
ncbi:Cytochrome P450 [Rhynchospora pubera]|uniref:Cytochrome P450 n=1 Tax=Rhynchospora pubera TaxID=906938 RepID=A0AAV8CR92_9POAL|nr:Cytochrome P450 [Rhynchospora pubera]